MMRVLMNTNDSVNKKVIPFSPPDISELEINEVVEALRSGWITTGPRTKELEKRLADYCGTSKVVCLNSATAAEELNFRICGIGEGDEVIVPAYTYSASASAAIHCGAKVVFVDSQKDNAEMDYAKVADAITEKTKAIVAVDLGGIVADYDKLFEIVEAKKDIFVPGGNNELGRKIQSALGRVLVFADGAHSLGAEKNGKKAGAIADFTDFSFHAAAQLQISLPSLSMQLRTSPLPRAVLPHGKISPASIMTRSITSTSFSASTDRARMPWLRRRSVPGNTTLSDHGTSAT